MFPKGHELLVQQGVRNIIWVPMMENGKIDESIGLDNRDLGLAEITVPFLRTIRCFLSLTTQRNENETMLFEMSQTNRLTSFCNRNRFMQDASELKEYKESVGVVYLDINGLKEINDSFGHSTGDKAVKECADIMKNSVDSKCPYHIGGDEFIIVYVDITEELFCDNVRLSKNASRKSRCQAVVGCRWNKECARIQDIIREADGLTYNDKK